MAGRSFRSELPRGESFAKARQKIKIKNEEKFIVKNDLSEKQFIILSN